MGNIYNGALHLKNQALQNIFIYTYGRGWTTQDSINLFACDVLDQMVITYVLSDENRRKVELEAVGELLDIDDPKGTLQCFLKNRINSPEKAMDLFHHIPLVTEFFQKVCRERELDDELPKDMIMFLSWFMLAIIAPDDQANLDLSLVSLRAYLTVVRKNMKHAGIEGEVKDSLTWPEYEEMNRIYIREKLEAGSYVSLGDGELDSIARPIFEVFRALVEESKFQDLMKAADEPDFFKRHEAFNFVEAREIMATEKSLQSTHSLEENTALYNLLQCSRKIFKYTDEVDRLADITNQIEGKSPTNRILSELTKKELVRFLEYLACSDGYISHQEVEAIRQISNSALDRQFILQEIREENLYTKRFAENDKVPLNLIRQVDAAANTQLKEYQEFADRYITEFEKAGFWFLQLDGEPKQCEKDDLALYIDSMKKTLPSAGGEH